MTYKLKYKDEPVVDSGKEGLSRQRNWHEQRCTGVEKPEPVHRAVRDSVGQEHRERWRSKQGPDQKSPQVMLGNVTAV